MTQPIFMKRLFFIFSIALSTLFFQSCNNSAADGTTEKKSGNNDEISESAVPAAVKSAFSAKYANATDVEWENAKEDDQPTYKAKFKKDGKEMKAEFGSDGRFLKEKD